MGLMDFFRMPNINKGVEEYAATPGAVLLDVRTPQEYEVRRIPGSTNLPLQELKRVEAVISHKDTPIFVYCHSGGRSSAAAKQLQRMGYTSVTNIGGIVDYLGKVER